ncbi:tyrosine-type recombinase/integrase [Streptomyces sp. NPDC059224]|uniref:tyrosine-type recombinase/integrase n=1 Tax=Streptomyces sp. NPDC059224 TaxID=3346775 RepID=UPI0036C8A1CF
MDLFLPTWSGRLTPHVLRHFCASSLYLRGVDLKAVQELLGHEWLSTTTRYINPRELHQAGEKLQVAWSTREVERVRTFLSQTTACGVEPVSHVWINDVLGVPARRLREDRLLHEAEATGGDPRRICDLFGLSVGAALRYTSTVGQEGLIEYNLRNAAPRPRARVVR